MLVVRAEPFSRGLRFSDFLEGECRAAETTLISNDYHRLGFSDVVVDPAVRQVYTCNFEAARAQIAGLRAGMGRQARSRMPAFVRRPFEMADKVWGGWKSFLIADTMETFTPLAFDKAPYEDSAVAVAACDTVRQPASLKLLPPTTVHTWHEGKHSHTSSPPGAHNQTL